MRVRVWKNTLDDAPAGVASRFGPQFRLPITIAKEYDVMALVQASGDVAMVQIVDDIEFPAWLPSWFFDVVDPTIPADWICNTLGDERGIALGPEFMVKDLESYAQMVLLEPDPVDRFWARVRRIEGERQAATRLVEVLQKIAAELEPYSQARAAARWREEVTTIALTLEAQKSGLRPEQRAALSCTFFDAADSLVNFSLSEQEFPDASQANARLLELMAALYEAME